MAAGAVVEDLDVVEDGGFQCRPGGPRAAVEEFGLQAGEEALSHGVIQRAADRAHAAQHPALLEMLAEGQGGVLGGFNRS